LSIATKALQYKAQFSINELLVATRPFIDPTVTTGQPGVGLQFPRVLQVAELARRSLAATSQGLRQPCTSYSNRNGSQRGVEIFFTLCNLFNISTLL
jgi:hypothetical protein